MEAVGNEMGSRGPGEMHGAAQQEVYEIEVMGQDGERRRVEGWTRRVAEPGS